MTNQANFWGKLVRELRKEQGISQRALAARASVNRGTLREMEAGEASVSYCPIGDVERLLAELGYELEAMKAATPHRG